MKITGSGPAIAVPTAVYLTLAIIIDSITKPVFTITENYYPALAVAGIIMILIAIPGIISSARKLVKSFNAGLLATDGLYKVCRNPLYAIYIFLMLPGICLLFNSWLVLSTDVVMFVLTLFFVRQEYAFLEETFGDEYRQYVQSVWIKFI